VAAALKVDLPLADAARTAIDARRAETAASLVRLDALAVEVEIEQSAATAARPAQPRRLQPLMPNEEQQSLLDLDRAGWPLVLHVDDERELSVALDVVARLIETNAATAAPRRHRVVLEHPMPLDTARLATLGLTVAMPLPSTWTGVAAEAAPGTATTTAIAAEGAPTAPRQAAIDPALLPFSFPLPTEVRLVMGSDIVADPRLGLQALVGGAAASATAAGASTGTEAGTDADADAAPVDRGLVAKALATLTSAAAESLGARAEWGTLEPGRLADVVVLSADLFELSESHLLDAVVTATVVDGKLVYDRDTDTPLPTP
jgi:predicted amidohydrolase YtcJ